ncbi:hypothetical protein ACWD6R_38230, partial [Streptomyces sp. NPDC005151]
GPFTDFLRVWLRHNDPDPSKRSSLGQTRNDSLLWVNAYVINDDLPNACHDLRRNSFPPEVACASMDGTLTGANAGWIEALFFASLMVSVMFTTMALVIVTIVRKR